MVDSIPDSSTDPVSVNVVTHPYSLVMSADCDLERDEESARKGKRRGKVLPSILLVSGFDADEARSRWGRDPSDWKNICRNSHQRFQVISAPPDTIAGTEAGLPALVFDFRQHFTVTPAALYAELDRGCSRAYRLASPYAQHLSQRFYSYMARIGLPVPHSVDDI